MRHQLAITIVGILDLLGAASAQANTVVGRDAALTDIEDPIYFGRRGAAYPNGEIGIAYSYYVCNTGSVQIGWEGPFNGPQPMHTNHPMWAFMVVRESNGRLVQLTNDATFVKHASSAGNDHSRCTTCQDPHTTTLLGVGCSDAYSQSTNANRFYLGPADEIDPWLGTWDPIHSYFDRGDPEVAAPANADGVRSLNGVFADAVKNRVTLQEADLLVPGQFHYFMHLMVWGEDADNRLDNIGHREVTPSWSGSTWSFTDVNPFVPGSVLGAWQGATVSMARNGDDDGTMFVGVKVTGPVAGLYHYEYAVHNLDNKRGAATLRIPVCPSTVVANTGFRDIDADPLNDWTWSRVADELEFQASTNALRWNQVFNFWFDCATPPVAGTVHLDEALPGLGALAVVVNTQVPGGSAAVVSLGLGCGSPSPVMTSNMPPIMPSPNHQLVITANPNAPLFLFGAPTSVTVPIGNGCVQYLDSLTLVSCGFLLAGPSGVVQVPAPVPSRPQFDGLTLHWQTVELVSGGPLFNQLALSNGLLTRVGCR